MFTLPKTLSYHKHIKLNIKTFNTNFFKSITKHFSSSSFVVERRARKFYKVVDISEIDNKNQNNPNNQNNNYTGNYAIDYFSNLSNLSSKYYAVTLDKRKCKTTNKDELKIPTKSVALAISDEWQTQNDYIDFYFMHFVSNCSSN